MKMNQVKVSLRSFLRRLAALASLVSNRYNRPGGGSSQAFVRSYRDSGRQQFRITTKRWIGKGRK